MESFGAYLKGLREEKGKTLEEIAENTKIAVANLHFLESDRYELLPPRVFVKGFIRSYVQELGLSPEATIRKFEEFTRDGELPDYGEEEHPVFHQQPAGGSFISSKWFTVALSTAGVVCLVFLLVAGVTRLFVWDNHTKGRQPVVKTSQPAGYDRSAVETEETQVADKPAAAGTSRAQAGKKILEIKALQSTWIRVEPDSGPAEELMMAPGDIQVFTAKESFSVQTGNAGGIKLRFDGRELPTLGRVNQTLSLTLP